LLRWLAGGQGVWAWRRGIEKVASKNWGVAVAIDALAPHNHGIGTNLCFKAASQKQ